MLPSTTRTRFQLGAHACFLVKHSLLGHPTLYGVEDLPTVHVLYATYAETLSEAIQRYLGLKSAQEEKSTEDALTRNGKAQQLTPLLTEEPHQYSIYDSVSGATITLDAHASAALRTQFLQPLRAYYGG